MYIESPGSVLKGADPSRVTRVRIEDVDVYLIGIEDLIIDRFVLVCLPNLLEFSERNSPLTKFLYIL